LAVNKFNSEGYYDPTPFEAISNIEREAKKKPFRPLVFVCSPYSGDIIKNTESARRYSRYVVKQNCIPLAPHLLFPQFLDDTKQQERDLGIFFGMVLMSKCAGLWVFGGCITTGMAVEIEKAMQRGMPIRYFSDRCEEVRPFGVSEGTY